VEASVWQLLRTGERRTERQVVLRSLYASTAPAGVEVDVASDLPLSFGTAAPVKQVIMQLAATTWHSLRGEAGAAKGGVLVDLYAVEADYCAG
jgi:hypothetical protein